VSDPREARIAELEAELAGWKRVAVEAVIPLEAMRMAGADKLHSDAIRQGIAHAIAIVRRAVTGGGLPAIGPERNEPGASE
jgi:hypothetical protein